MTGAVPAGLGELIPHYGLVLLRVAALFVFVPIFGSNLIPMRLRMMVAAGLAVAFLPLAPLPDPAPASWVAWGLAGVRELSVGLVLGLGARALFAGVESSAALVAGQSGFAMANMVDPTSGDQALAPTLFQNLLGLSLFLAADLHHLFVRAIVTSYELLPPAGALPSFAGLDAATSRLGLRLFAVAVELAAPALVVTVLVDLVMGLVGRTMPQVPILLVGFPVKMAAGLVAMAVLATATGAAVGWIGRTMAADSAALLAALAAR